MVAGTCVFCGSQINPELDYQKVTGWEKRRSQGGTNAVRLREPQDEWACRFCVDRAAKNVAPQQGSLL